MSLKQSLMINLFRSRVGHGYVWLETFERKLWCCARQRWIECDSAKSSLRLMGLKLSAEVFPVFTPFRSFLVIRPSGWLVSQSRLEFWFQGSFLKFKFKVESSMTKTKDLIDRGAFYRYNTAPWAKGEKQ